MNTNIGLLGKFLTKILWTHYTFNPWIGCTKISPGCDFCYAEYMMDTRFGRVRWGHGAPRQRTHKANWNLVRRWHRRAIEADNWTTQEDGRLIQKLRPRVFVASLADVFDTEVEDSWRNDLFALIRECWGLDFLLLTKRPSVARRYAIELDTAGKDWPWNAWMGTSVENQDTAFRLRDLDEIPAPVHFLSCEPLLGPLQLDLSRIDWVIVGGESGPNARPMQKEWAESIKKQCEDQSTLFFFKQWGGRGKDKGGHLWLDGSEKMEVPTNRLATFQEEEIREGKLLPRIPLK